MDVKLSTQNIRTIAMFEKVTKVNAKDCIITDNALYFLVDMEKAGMAIGKNGANIKELRRISGKHVKIFPYSPNLEEFIKNIIPNIKSVDITDKRVTISVPHEDKLTVIGKHGENINAMRDMLKRHFDVESLKLR
ncbi:MAG: NusA-like transcription termination signal-binding factor [Candidatus Aenigmarchaeota archaeon]|nr:NusA-like transcription termination signal-binding factor [Candidatus Aenigmarchaeota archaeon]